jgi:monoterpene epsilon-lactone hydrolase
MPSSQSDALRAHYQTMTDRMAADPEMDLVTLRSMLEELSGRAREPEGVTYSEVDADGVHGIWCTPTDATSGRVILYLHGGGFVSNTASSHRKLAGHLAKAAGARAFVLEYRLAPEHPFPAQLEDAVAAYRWLVGQGIEAGHIATAGDSAGGNLSTTLVVKLRELGEALPGAVVAFSPWVDMEHTGKTLETNAETDALVSRGVVGLMSGMFLGESGSPTDPFANPLHADLTGLPPMYVTAGGAETLLDDAQRLHDRAREHGVEVEIAVSPDQQHVFPFMAGRAAEADEAVSAAGAWIAAKTG